MYLSFMASMMSSLLVDDKGQAQHLLLDKFYSTGAQDVFFKTPVTVLATTGPPDMFGDSWTWENGAFRLVFSFLRFFFLIKGHWVCGFLLPTPFSLPIKGRFLECKLSPIRV